MGNVHSEQERRNRVIATIRRIAAPLMVVGLMGLGGNAIATDSRIDAGPVFLSPRTPPRCTKRKECVYFVKKGDVLDRYHSQEYGIFREIKVVDVERRGVIVSVELREYINDMYKCRMDYGDFITRKRNCGPGWGVEYDLLTSRGIFRIDRTRDPKVAKITMVRKE